REYRWSMPCYMPRPANYVCATWLPAWDETTPLFRINCVSCALTISSPCARLAGLSTIAWLMTTSGACLPLPSPIPINHSQPFCNHTKLRYLHERWTRSYARDGEADPATGLLFNLDYHRDRANRWLPVKLAGSVLGCGSCSD